MRSLVRLSVMQWTSFRCPINDAKNRRSCSQFSSCTLYAINIPVMLLRDSHAMVVVDFLHLVRVMERRGKGIIKKDRLLHSLWGMSIMIEQD